MAYEFGTDLYSSRNEMIAGAVYQWITAGGSNSPETIDAFDLDPEKDVDEMIEGWGLDSPSSTGDLGWMERHRISRDELVEEFESFMLHRPDRPEAEAD